MMIAEPDPLVRQANGTVLLCSYRATMRRARAWARKHASDRCYVCAVDVNVVPDSWDWAASITTTDMVWSTDGKKVQVRTMTLPDP